MGTGVPGEPADADVPGEGDAAEPCPDDGLACTEVLRDEEGDCITVLQPGFCLIGGACWFAFQPEPELPCFFCVPDLDAGAFVAYQGLACDDGDPCTSGDVCGPEGECSPGVPTDCNDLNADTVQWRATPGDGTTGDLYQYYGERWPGATCEPAAPGCQWAVYSIMVSGTCGPLYGFLEAALAGNLLVGGGPLGTAPLYLVFGSLRILVMVQAARVEVTLSLAGGGSVGQGGLAGGVNKQSLLAAVEAAPADQFPPPLLRDIVLQYVTLYLQPDLDLDHDGSPKSVSLGVPFTLVSGEIVGPLGRLADTAFSPFVAQSTFARLTGY